MLTTGLCWLTGSAILAMIGKNSNAAMVEVDEPVAYADVDDFRQAMRRLGSGVTIVATTDGNGQPCGLMMTAVMSLSLDPPSMLIAVNRSASALPALLEREIFSINLIGAGDEEMCKLFAASDAQNRFVPEDWAQRRMGAPIFRNAIATIICVIDAVETFGTHTIIRGLVRDAAFEKDAEGLIYMNGRFCGVRCSK
jgi:flavin reductase (DIM6/NTAB) family NADH-FMN oxidoreductase RutF